MGGKKLMKSLLSGKGTETTNLPHFTDEDIKMQESDLSQT